MQLKAIQEALNVFGKYVVQQSRSNLSKGRKNASKNLYNSINYKIENNNGELSILFDMEDYGEFQDKGVKGTKSNYIENSQSPYTYKSKGGKRGLKGMPPPKAFDKWIVRKGLKDIRDKQGRFLPRKTLQFLIAKSVFEKGIKASMFFTTPFERAYQRLPDELRDKYILDIERELDNYGNKN